MPTQWGGIEDLKKLLGEMNIISDPFDSLSIPAASAGYYAIDIDTRIFKTRFSPDDVDEFLDFFRQRPAVKNRNYIGGFLKSCLRNWAKAHPGKCPYEPFLWALKIQDNYVGSIQNNAVPDKTLLEPVCLALRAEWRDAPEYLNVLRNVILNWDWYQPAHVAMKLYELLDGVNDEEIERCIREHWLYRSMYTHTAFYCLLTKRKTPANIAALMTYISKEQHKDEFGAKIDVVNRIRRDFLVNYASYFTADEKRIAEAYFRENLFNCSQKARSQVFDYLFVTDSSSELDELIQNFQNARNARDQKQAADAFRAHCARVMDQRGSHEFTDLIRDLSLPNSLRRELIDLTRQAPVSFSTQFILKSMLQSGAQDYLRYIEESYRAFGVNGLNDERGFLYACAYCISGHPELIDRLAEMFYLKGVGLTNVRYLFFDIRARYAVQYGQCTENLKNRCLGDMDKAISLIANCTKVFSGKNATVYPTEFDEACKLLVDTAAMENNPNAKRCADVAVHFIDNVATRNNRSRYYDMLIKLVRTESYKLKDARKKAEIIMVELWK